MFSLLAVTSLHPPQQLEGTQFSETPSAFILCRLFAEEHSDGCEVNISVIGFAWLYSLLMLRIFQFPFILKRKKRKDKMCVKYAS